MQDPARNPDFRTGGDGQGRLESVRGKYMLPAYILRATDSYAGKPYYNNFSGFTGLIAISAKDCFPQDIFYFFR
jgi:hypothetical protein